MYTDNTILSKGRYKFTALCRVPPKYLLNILNSKNRSDPELYQYVSDNLEVIRLRLNGDTPPIELMLPCRKAAFYSEKAAKTALAQIRETDDRCQKKPIRAYECDICGSFHLTSWSIEFFKENT